MFEIKSEPVIFLVYLKPQCIGLCSNQTDLEARKDEKYNTVLAASGVAGAVVVAVIILALFGFWFAKTAEGEEEDSDKNQIRMFIRRSRRRSKVRKSVEKSGKTPVLLV